MKRKRKQKRKRPIDFDEVGKTVAKLLDVKRRLVQASLAGGDQEYARQVIENLRNYVQMLREGLEIGLREPELTDLAPEIAQQAIYGCHLLEASLELEPERPQ